VATDKALKFLAGYAISEERVIAVLGKPKHEWASEDIASLRGMASRPRDGQVTAEHLFPATEATEHRPKATTPKEETKAKRGPAPKAEAPVNTTPSASLLPQAATPVPPWVGRRGCRLARVCTGSLLFFFCFFKRVWVHIILKKYLNVPKTKYAYCLYSQFLQ
jgi:hypothetical protein